MRLAPPILVLCLLAAPLGALSPEPALPALRAPLPPRHAAIEDRIHEFLGEGRRDPLVAFLLSAVPPVVSVQGGGQIYNGQIGKGLFFFAIGQVSIAAASTAVDESTRRVAVSAYAAAWIWSSIDAYRTASRLNRERGHPGLRPHRAAP